MPTGNLSHLHPQAPEKGASALTDSCTHVVQVKKMKSKIWKTQGENKEEREERREGKGLVIEP